MPHISLCNINLKKINYNKQKKKGYKNMISDMTCLHFSWMTLLLVKKKRRERKKKVSHFSIHWTSDCDTFQWLMQTDTALGESICFPPLENCEVFIQTTLTASLLVLFIQSSRQIFPSTAINLMRFQAVKKSCLDQFNVTGTFHHYKTHTNAVPQ